MAVDPMRRRALCCLAYATVTAALPRPRRAMALRALRVRGGGPVDGALDKIRDLTTTPAGSVAFVSIYMAMELCGIPSVPLAAAAGVAYPTKVALAVVLASSVTAACVAYYVGRTRLRPRLDKRISKDRRLRAISAAVRDEGFAILLLLRMVPMPPAINYLYGAMAPKFPAYFLSTLLGYLPGTVGTVLAAKGATVALPRWCYVAGGLAVLALVGTTVATGRRVSRQLDAYERRV